MSIYFAAQTKKSSKATMAYTSRGLENLTQTAIGSMSVFAKPHFEQLAYSGYSKAIEAFLSATATGNTVITHARNYPVEPVDNEIIVRLPLRPPSIAFKLENQRPSEKFLTSFHASLEKYGGKSTLSGKTQIYTIPNAPNIILDKLASVVHENPVYLEQHCSVAGASAFNLIRYFIDLFLRTHLYEATREENVPLVQGRLTVWGKDSARSTAKTVRDDEFEGSMNYVKAMKMSDGSKRYDPLLSKEQGYVISSTIDIAAAVLVAKPSSETSSAINFGAPSEVPNKPGFLFPYFNGMIIPDAPNMRDLFHRLFFRLLPLDNEASPQKAWKEFRIAIMSLSSTPEGLMLHHLLKGAELALEGQARLFALFADEEYKGFVLIGECLTVHVNGVKYDAMSPEDLRSELEKIPTKVRSATELAIAMEGLELVAGGNPTISADEATDVFKVASILAKVDISSTPSDVISNVQQGLKQMSFRNEYRTFAPSTITGALRDLLLHSKGEVEIEKLPFYIPIKDWNGIDEPIYQILARFGSTSFSFRSSTKGTEIEIPAELSKGVEGEESSLVWSSESSVKSKVFYYEKPVAKAVADWRVVLETGTLQYDLNERAGSMKAQSFSGESRIPIVETLVEFKKAGVFGKGKGIERVPKAMKPSKPRAVVVDFDDEFSF